MISQNRIYDIKNADFIVKRRLILNKSPVQLVILYNTVNLLGLRNFKILTRSVSWLEMPNTSVMGITSTSYFSVHFKNTTFWIMEGKFLCSGDSLGLADLSYKIN